MKFLHPRIPIKLSDRTLAWVCHAPPDSTLSLIQLLPCVWVCYLVWGKRVRGRVHLTLSVQHTALLKLAELSFPKDVLLTVGYLLAVDKVSVVCGCIAHPS